MPAPEPLPIVMVSGLLASARLYEDQIPALWRFGPVIVADHTRDSSMAAIARRILNDAPPVFALAGLSMGGYISLEIMRQAPGRVRKLILLDTSARPDRPDQTERRRAQMALARAGELDEIVGQQYPILVDPARRDDAELRRLVKVMAEDVGTEAFIRQQSAIIGRADSRPSLAAIACPTLVLVGEGDQITPLEHAQELATGISDSRLAIIPRCGHLSTLEQPEAVTHVLTDWLHA